TQIKHGQPDAFWPPFRRLSSSNRLPLQYRRNWRTQAKLLLNSKWAENANLVLILAPILVSLRAGIVSPRTRDSRKPNTASDGSSLAEKASGRTGQKPSNTSAA